MRDHVELEERDLEVLLGASEGLRHLRDDLSLDVADGLRGVDARAESIEVGALDALSNEALDAMLELWIVHDNARSWGYRATEATGRCERGALVVIELSVAARHEHDDLMLWFAGVGARRSLETDHWIGQPTNRGTSMSATPDLEGYDEWLAKFLPTLSPEQIRTALSPEHVVLALSDEALRALAPSFIETLPRDVQKAIAARLGAATPAKSKRRAKG